MTRKYPAELLSNSDVATTLAIDIVAASLAALLATTRATTPAPPHPWDNIYLNVQ